VSKSSGSFSLPSGDVLTATRDSLHGLAEWLLAGPQYVRTGTIRLRVVEGGVETQDGRVALSADELVVRGADAESRHMLTGTVRTLAGALGIEPSLPAVYSDHAPVTLESAIEVDVPTARGLFQWFCCGHGGLLAFAPGEEPVLWPEHFDLGISSSEVNFGVSPGDDIHPEPYAYVSPWTSRSGDFWNAPFGAVRSAAELPDSAAVAAFFDEGARRSVEDLQN
jgi:hypothetical protein